MPLGVVVGSSSWWIVAATATVRSDTATVPPTLFVAVTRILSARPTSPAVSTYVALVAFGIVEQFEASAAQRHHCKAYVIVPAPVQVPAVAVNVCPCFAVPVDDRPARC